MVLFILILCHYHINTIIFIIAISIYRIIIIVLLGVIKLLFLLDSALYYYIMPFTLVLDSLFFSCFICRHNFYVLLSFFSPFPFFLPWLPLDFCSPPFPLSFALPFSLSIVPPFNFTIASLVPLLSSFRSLLLFTPFSLFFLPSYYPSPNFSFPSSFLFPSTPFCVFPHLLPLFSFLFLLFTSLPSFSSLVPFSPLFRLLLTSLSLLFRILPEPTLSPLQNFTLSLLLFTLFYPCLLSSLPSISPLSSLPSTFPLSSPLYPLFPFSHLLFTPFPPLSPLNLSPFPPHFPSPFYPLFPNFPSPPYPLFPLSPLYLLSPLPFIQYFPSPLYPSFPSLYPFFSLSPLSPPSPLPFIPSFPSPFPLTRGRQPRNPERRCVSPPALYAENCNPLIILYRIFSRLLLGAAVCQSLPVRSS